MTQIFTAFLITSCIGTAFAFLLLLIKALMRRHFSYNWYYYMWMVVLLVMLIPIRIDMPAPENTIAVKDVNRGVVDNREMVSDNTFEENIIANDVIIPEATIHREFVILSALSPAMISYIWLIVAALLFMIKIIKYIIFLKKMYANSDATECPQINSYINKKIEIRKSDKITSPLTVGVLKPVLLLPKAEITQEQLHYILVHECTHLKRNDILYKWLIAIVKCVHWFNPFVYAIAERINIDCEISCDISVTNNMSMAEKKGYMETILALLSSGKIKQIAMTTGMTGNKRKLKQRFKNISNKKTVSKRMIIISVIVAIAIILGAFLVSGIINNRFVLPEKADIIADTRRGEEFNFLMIGEDNSGRADTIMVFNFDGRILTGMNVPRNINIIGKEENNFQNKTISQLLAEKDGDKKVAEAIKNLLEIPINYYARINIKAVEDIVNNVGGLKFEIPYDMVYDDPAQDLHINLSAGKQILNGEQVGHLLRFKDRQHPDGEGIRKITWFTVIKEFIIQAVTEEKIQDISKLYKLLSNNVTTNYSPDDLLHDWESFKQIDRNNVVIRNLPGRNVVLDNGYFVYHINHVEAEPLLRIFNSSSNAENLMAVVTYENNELGFRIKLPEVWKSRYRIMKFDNQVAFVHREIFEKYGKGHGKLFEITKIFPPHKEETNDAEIKDQIYWSKDFAFVWSVASDVQYPVWNDRDEEDIRLAEDFEDMLIDLEFIKQSFEAIPSRGNMTNNNVATQPTLKTEGYSGENQLQTDRLTIKSSSTDNESFGGFERVDIKGASSQYIQKTLEIQGISAADTGVVDLEENYIVGKYSYKDNLNYKNEQIKCDSNGNITVYFDVNTDNLVNVHFNDYETGEDVGQYRIMTNNENAYTFTGFKPDGVYDVSISGETGGDWKIEGEYIIY